MSGRKNGLRKHVTEAKEGPWNLGERRVKVMHLVGRREGGGKKEGESFVYSRVLGPAGSS